MHTSHRPCGVCISFNMAIFKQLKTKAFFTKWKLINIMIDEKGKGR